MALGLLMADAVKPAILVVLAALILPACGPRVVAAPQAMPAPVQLGLLRLPRVWVAGFVANGNAGLDLSGETTRLLRQKLSGVTTSGVVDGHVLSLSDEAVFTDREYWRQLGEERGYPLIVTGTVRLLLAPAVQVQRGRRTTYLHGTGRVLDATVVLIDGRNGDVIATTDLPRRTRYGTGPTAAPFVLYHRMMTEMFTDWLAAIAGTTDGTARRAGTVASRGAVPQAGP